MAKFETVTNLNFFCCFCLFFLISDAMSKLYWCLNRSMVCLGGSAEYHKFTSQHHWLLASGNYGYSRYLEMVSDLCIALVCPLTPLWLLPPSTYCSNRFDLWNGTGLINLLVCNKLSWSDKRMSIPVLNGGDRWLVTPAQASRPLLNHQNWLI